MSACNRSAFQPSFGDQDEFPRKYPKKKTPNRSPPPPWASLLRWHLQGIWIPELQRLGLSAVDGN